MYQNGYINQLSAIRRIYESQRFISGSAKEFITYTKLFFFNEYQQVKSKTCIDKRVNI